MKIVRVFGVLVWVGVLGVCFGEGSAQGIKRPSARELLAKYTATQEKTKSFIIKSTSVTEYKDNEDPARLPMDAATAKKLAGGCMDISQCELRSDGKRVYFRHVLFLEDNEWGKKNVGKIEAEDFERREYDGRRAMYKSYLYDGKNYYSNVPLHPGTTFTKKGRSFTGSVHLVRGVHKSRTIPGGGAGDDNLSRANPGHTLMGYLAGDHQRVDVALKDAERMAVRKQMEAVGASECYVIDAYSHRGKYTLWIDPTHDCHLAKAKVLRREGNKFYTITFTEGYKMICTLENVKFERIDGMWVPMEGDSYYRQDAPLAFNEAKTHHRRIKVLLNPDHNALGSFVPSDIADGSEVQLLNSDFEADDALYIWRDGKVVDGEGKEVLVIDE
jgi:hypothetical protein